MTGTRIHYKDIRTGKKHYTKAEYGYEVQNGVRLGQPCRFIMVRRRTDTLWIPEWCVLPESRHLLTA